MFHVTQFGSPLLLGSPFTYGVNISNWVFGVKHFFQKSAESS